MIGHWKLKFKNFTEVFTCLKVISKIRKLKNLENIARIANARWKISQIMPDINSQQHEKEKAQEKSMPLWHNGTDRRIMTAVLLIRVGQLTFLKSTCPHSFYINAKS